MDLVQGRRAIRRFCHTGCFSGILSLLAFPSIFIMKHLSFIPSFPASSLDGIVVLLGVILSGCEHLGAEVGEGRLLERFWLVNLARSTVEQRFGHEGNCHCHVSSYDFGDGECFHHVTTTLILWLDLTRLWVEHPIPAGPC